MFFGLPVYRVVNQDFIYNESPRFTNLLMKEPERMDKKNLSLLLKVSMKIIAQLLQHILMHCANINNPFNRLLS